jgi:hypothetical protein
MLCVLLVDDCVVMLVVDVVPIGPFAGELEAEIVPVVAATAEAADGGDDSRDDISLALPTDGLSLECCWRFPAFILTA